MQLIDFSKFSTSDLEQLQAAASEITAIFDKQIPTSEERVALFVRDQRYFQAVNISRYAFSEICRRAKRLSL
jgi:hypothetical protein